MSDEREGAVPPSERRRNAELRERLDEMVELARHLCREATKMSVDELEEARQRIEWLAEQVWETAVYGPLEGRTRPPA
jgi:hypothetical protein